jgi:hypothetical protein
MRNGVSFYKQYRRRLALSSGLVLVLAASSPTAAGLPRQPQPAYRFRVPGTPAPALAALFVPRRAPAGSFEVAVLDCGIEDARRVLLEAAHPGPPRPPAGPPVRKLDPLDAFGDAGAYQRTTVARLYGGRKAQVVRMPVERDGRTVAAVTLVSPYPDPTLSRLVEGTMVIVLHVNSTQ